MRLHFLRFFLKLYHESLLNYCSDETVHLTLIVACLKETNCVQIQVKSLFQFGKIARKLFIQSC